MPKNKSVTWEMDDHSLGKHLVFKRYIDAWLPILSKYNGRLLIIDGFSGPGEYKNGYYGSPIIALDAAIQHQHYSVRTQEIVFYFIEENSQRLDHLKQLVSERYPNLPKNIHIHYAQNAFDQEINSLLNDIEDQKKRLAPCFAMIDPFGVSDTPMSIIHRLLSNPKAEVYVSVMYEHINRFLKTPEFKPHLDKLFGCNEWQDAFCIDDRHARKLFLYDIYKKQLKKTKATNALHFDLYRGNRHVYSIFFATQNWKGTDKMKEAIWRIAPEGDFIFKGGQPSSINLLEADYSPLIESISNQFVDRWVFPSEIAAFVGTDQTEYYSSQIKKNALKPLEIEGRLEIHPDDVSKRSRRFTYKEGIRIRILPKKA